MLQSVLVNLVGRNHKWKTGRDKQELWEKVGLLDGVLVDNWEKLWFANQKIGPQLDHA